MNPASEWRLILARDVVTPAYRTIPGMCVALLVGSAAQGLADSYSDVDMLVYWESMPAESARRAVIAQIDGWLGEVGDTSEDDDPALQSAGEVFYLAGDRDSGLKIDVTHKTIASVDVLIDDVVIRHDKTPIKLAIMRSLKRSLPLAGAEHYNAWRTHIGDCPLPLAEQLVRENLLIKPQWAFAMFTHRPDPLFYQRYIVELVEQVMALLVGINRMYPPFRYKHLARTIEELTIKPPNLLNQIEHILAALPAEAQPLVNALVTQVYDLIDTHMPQVDTTAARTSFTYHRPVHDAMPESLKTGVTQHD